MFKIHFGLLDKSGKEYIIIFLQRLRKSMGKKLLFITTRLFWPIDSGKKVALYYYCQGLKEVYDFEIYIYSFLEAGQTSRMLKDKPYFIKDVRIAKKVNLINQFKNIIYKTFFNHDFPIQCSLFYNKQNLNEIKMLCNEIQPDVIIVDMVRLAPYFLAFQNLNAKKILYMEDLLSERYKRQLESSYKSSIAGQYRANLSTGFLKLIEIKSIKNLILKIEKSLMYSAELKYANIYEKVIFVSSKEANKLNKYYSDKAIDIPLGINVKEFFNCKYQNLKENNICFVGNMYVAANIDTLKLIITEVLPYIKSKYKFYIVGKVSEQLKKQYSEYANIVFTGRIDNIYDIAGKCKLFLAPIAYGSGIKTKILEAMAMQMPVITNDVGAEGLDVENQKHLIIENNTQKIARIADYYLNNYAAALKIAENAQQLVFERYDWEKIWKKFKFIV